MLGKFDWPYYRDGFRLTWKQTQRLIFHHMPRNNSARVYIIVVVIMSCAHGLMASNYGLTLQSGGLNLFTMMLPNVFFFMVGSLLETPTGIFADQISLKMSASLGIMSWAIAEVLYGYGAYSKIFAVYLGAEFLAAFGKAFLSGAFFALLCQTSGKAGNNRCYLGKVEAGSRAIGQRAGILFRLLAGILIQFTGIILPWLISCMLMLIALTVLIKYMPSVLRQNKTTYTWATMVRNMRRYNITVLLAWRHYQRSKLGRNIVFGSAIMEFCYQPLNMLWSIHFAEVFTAVGAGVVSALIAVGLGEGSNHIRKHQPSNPADFISRCITKISCTIIIGSIAGILGFPLLLAIGFVAHEYWRGMVGPLGDTNITYGIKVRSVQATALSLAETIENLARVLGLLVFGLIAYYFGIVPSWMISSVCMWTAKYFFNKAAKEEKS